MVAVLLALLALAGCGDDVDDTTQQAKLLRSLAGAIVPPSGAWAPAPDAIEGCAEADGSTLVVPPRQQLIAPGTDDVSSYLDGVEDDLPVDARQVDRGDGELSWTTLGPDGETISVRVAVSARATTITATGPTTWCD